MSVWNQTKKKGGDGGSFEKAPPGNHPAVLVAVIDMGTQRNEYNGEVNWQRRAFFVWELVTRKQTANPAKNHVIAIDLTVSLNEKAKLCQWIEARTGKRISEGGDYDISKELGQQCLLNVIEKNGYPKIAGVAAVPDGLTMPPAQNKPFILALDDFRAGKTALPDFVPYLYGEPLSDHIRRCKEITGAPAEEKHAPDADDGTDDFGGSGDSGSGTGGYVPF